MNKATVWVLKDGRVQYLASFDCARTAVTVAYCVKSLFEAPAFVGPYPDRRDGWHVCPAVLDGYETTLRSLLAAARIPVVRALLLVGIVSTAYTADGLPDVRWQPRTFTDLGLFSGSTLRVTARPRAPLAFAVAAPTRP